MSKDPYQIKKLLTTKNGTFTYYSLAELEKQGYMALISCLFPFAFYWKMRCAILMILL